jgi:hypothetical protein
MITKNEWRQAAVQLMQSGHCFLPVNADRVKDCNDSMLALMKRLDGQSINQWQRPDEQEPELGLVQRDGTGGKDLKYLLQYAHDLHVHMEASGHQPDAQEQRHWSVLRSLYDKLGGLAIGLVTEIAERDKHFFVTDRIRTNAMVGNCAGRYIADELGRCQTLTRPGSVSTLRGLWYPAAPEQRGAKPHFDRSLLTIHLGDAGGELLALDGPDAPPSTGRPVSPPPGEALIFWGAKASLVTQPGVAKPLWHASTTAGGERRALVYFAHIDVGIPAQTVADIMDHPEKVHVL